MKKEKLIILFILLSLVLLSSCNGTAHLNNEETRTICVPYCNERDMSINMDMSMTYTNTIVCACDSEPILRTSK